MTRRRSSWSSLTIHGWSRPLSSSPPLRSRRTRRSSTRSTPAAPGTRRGWRAAHAWADRTCWDTMTGAWAVTAPEHRLRRASLRQRSWGLWSLGYAPRVVRRGQGIWRTTAWLLARGASGAATAGWAPTGMPCHRREASGAPAATAMGTCIIKSIKHGPKRISCFPIIFYLIYFD